MKLSFVTRIEGYHISNKKISSYQMIHYEKIAFIHDLWLKIKNEFKELGIGSYPVP